MPEIDPRYAAVIAQAETLCGRQRAEYEAMLVAREAQQQAWLSAQAQRLTFLKQSDANPMDVADYDAWLASFVSNGGELTHFVEGSFPRIRLMSEDVSMMLADSVLLTPQAGPSLAEAYYAEPVIWTIDQAFDLTDLPALLGDQSLTLHLTQRAVKNFTATELQAAAAAGALGDNEFYVDGSWSTIAGVQVWQAAAYAVHAIAYVWDENVRNMLGKKVLL